VLKEISLNLIILYEYIVRECNDMSTFCQLTLARRHFLGVTEGWTGFVLRRVNWRFVPTDPAVPVRRAVALTCNKKSCMSSDMSRMLTGHTQLPVTFVK
jgi:hypothetical protein